MSLGGESSHTEPQNPKRLDAVKTPGIPWVKARDDPMEQMAHLLAAHQSELDAVQASARLFGGWIGWLMGILILTMASDNSLIFQFTMYLEPSSQLSICQYIRSLWFQIYRESEDEGNIL